MPEMSNVKLSNLMINLNQLAAVLAHLQGVIDSLQQVQFCEYAHRLSDQGELDDGETVAARLVEEVLDNEFGELEEFPLGTSSGVPGQDTANTSRGNGQCTHQKLVQYITNTSRIFQANLIAVFPAQEMPSTSRVFPVM